eukprot:3645520-Pyramimonas_sp.AAC.1
MLAAFSHAGYSPCYHLLTPQSGGGLCSSSILSLVITVTFSCKSNTLNAFRVAGPAGAPPSRRKNSSPYHKVTLPRGLLRNSNIGNISGVSSHPLAVIRTGGPVKRSNITL